MVFKKILIALLLLTPSLSSAEESHDVPDKLFGITLGGIYDLGDPENNDLGDIPVKKFTGIEKFFGAGIHYYFKPEKKYDAFDYVEKLVGPRDKYFKTSFRLYLLPVIPSTITAIEQLEKVKLNWEVVTIEWSRDMRTNKEALDWAMDLCGTFKADISVAAEISDLTEDWYVCTFSSGDREFEVRSLGAMRRIELSYKKEVFDAKNQAVEKILRKLQRVK